MINFYDEHRQKVMVFSDFSQQEDTDYFAIRFKVRINYAFFSAVTSIECEKKEMNDLFINLKKLYNLKVDTVTFTPIERQIKMKFDLKENGQIIVLVQLYDYRYKAILQFEYNIDQSFLPELIDEIEYVLE